MNGWQFKRYDGDAIHCPSPLAVAMALAKMQHQARRFGSRLASGGNRLKIHKNIFLDFMCWSEKHKKQQQTNRAPHTPLLLLSVCVCLCVWVIKSAGGLWLREHNMKSIYAISFAPITRCDKRPAPKTSILFICSVLKASWQHPRGRVRAGVVEGNAVYRERDSATKSTQLIKSKIKNESLMFQNGNERVFGDNSYREGSWWEVSNITRF